MDYKDSNNGYRTVTRILDGEQLCEYYYSNIVSFE